MELVHWLFQTDGSIAALILRMTLAVVIFPHGAQKVLGWFGGHGFSGTMKYFVGLRNSRAFDGPRHDRRVSRSARACCRISNADRRARDRLRYARAIVKVHWQFGFFLNWFGNQ